MPEEGCLGIIQLGNEWSELRFWFGEETLLAEDRFRSKGVGFWSWPKWWDISCWPIRQPWRCPCKCPFCWPWPSNSCRVSLVLWVDNPAAQNSLTQTYRRLEVKSWLCSSCILRNGICQPSREGFPMFSLVITAWNLGINPKLIPCGELPLAHGFVDFGIFWRVGRLLYNMGVVNIITFKLLYWCCPCRDWLILVLSPCWLVTTA